MSNRAVPVRVSVVVPTFRRPDMLRETLASLCAVDYPHDRYEIVVVDDASDPETERVVRDLGAGHPEIRYTAQVKRGAAAARNRGARLASGDLVIFCDDDMIVEAPHVRQHLATHDAYGECLVNGGHRDFTPSTLATLRATPFGRYRISLEHRFRSAGPNRTLGDDCVEAQALSACDLSIRRQVFCALGGFDEAFPWAGAEDQDLSLRARRAGHRLVRNNAIRLLTNEPTITLRQFCLREERAAETFAVLASKHRDEYADRAYLVENRPVSRDDPARLVLKKIAKLMLSNDLVLTLGHRMTALLERTGVGDARLHRLYSALIGLHMFRGVRRRLKAL